MRASRLRHPIGMISFEALLKVSSYCERVLHFASRAIVIVNAMKSVISLSAVSNQTDADYLYYY